VTAFESDLSEHPDSDIEEEALVDAAEEGG